MAQSNSQEIMSYEITVSTYFGIYYKVNLNLIRLLSKVFRIMLNDNNSGFIYVFCSNVGFADYQIFFKLIQKPRTTLDDFLDISFDTLLRIIHLLHNFKIRSIEKIVSAMLRLKLTEDNMLEAWRLAQKLELKEIAAFIRRKILNNGEIFLSRPEFWSLSKYKFSSLLEDEKLNCMETTVYFAVTQWIVNTQIREGAIGDLVRQAELWNDMKHLIRFPNFSVYEMRTLIQFRGFLGDEEYNYLIQNILNPGLHTSKNWGGFNHNRRHVGQNTE